MRHEWIFAEDKVGDETFHCTLAVSEGERSGYNPEGVFEIHSTCSYDETHLAREILRLAEENRLLKAKLETTDSHERAAIADEHEWTDRSGIKWRATQDGLFEFDSSGYLREVCEGDVGIETPIEAPAREILRLAARVRELEAENRRIRDEHLSDSQRYAISDRIIRDELLIAKAEVAALDPTGHLRKLVPPVAELERAMALPASEPAKDPGVRKIEEAYCRAMVGDIQDILDRAIKAPAPAIEGAKSVVPNAALDSEELFEREQSLARGQMWEVFAKSHGTVPGKAPASESDENSPLGANLVSDHAAPEKA